MRFGQFLLEIGRQPDPSQWPSFGQQVLRVEHVCGNVCLGSEEQAVLAFSSQSRGLGGSRDLRRARGDVSRTTIVHGQHKIVRFPKLEQKRSLGCLTYVGDERGDLGRRVLKAVLIGNGGGWRELSDRKNQDR